MTLTILDHFSSAAKSIDVQIIIDCGKSKGSKLKCSFLESRKLDQVWAINFTIFRQTGIEWNRITAIILSSLMHLSSQMRMYFWWMHFKIFASNSIVYKQILSEALLRRVWLWEKYTNYVVKMSNDEFVRTLSEHYCYFAIRTWLERKQYTNHVFLKTDKMGNNKNSSTIMTVLTVNVFSILHQKFVFLDGYFVLYVRTYGLSKFVISEILQSFIVASVTVFLVWMRSE